MLPRDFCSSGGFAGQEGGLCGTGPMAGAAAWSPNSKAWPPGSPANIWQGASEVAADPRWLAWQWAPSHGAGGDEAALDGEDNDHPPPGLECLETEKCVEIHLDSELLNILCRRGRRRLRLIQTDCGVGARLDRARSVLHVSGSEAAVQDVRRQLSSLRGPRKAVSPAVWAELMRTRTLADSSEDGLVAWLQQESGCRIHIERTRQEVRIFGPNEDVAVAEQMLEELERSCTEDLAQVCGGTLRADEGQAVKVLAQHLVAPDEVVARALPPGPVAPQQHQQVQQSQQHQAQVSAHDGLCTTCGVGRFCIYCGSPLWRHLHRPPDTANTTARAATGSPLEADVLAVLRVVQEMTSVADFAKILEALQDTCPSAAGLAAAHCLRFCGTDVGEAGKENEATHVTDPRSTKGGVAAPARFAPGVAPQRCLPVQGAMLPIGHGRLAEAGDIFVGDGEPGGPVDLEVDQRSSGSSARGCTAWGLRGSPSERFPPVDNRGRQLEAAAVVMGLSVGKVVDGGLPQPMQTPTVEAVPKPRAGAFLVKGIDALAAGAGRAPVEALAQHLQW